MIKSQLSSIRQAFSNTLLKLAASDPNLFVVSCDLKSSLTLSKFASKYRSRFIECGAAENNAASIAAGLSHAGKTVFLCSYACFSPGINWATIKQSICYNHYNVKIIGSHGGLATAELGATHQMLEDISLMRAMPNMEVFAPSDALETEKIITAIARSTTPSYVRLVRPSTPNIYKTSPDFSIGHSQILQSGSDITIAGYGPILSEATSLNNRQLEIINCSSIKPLDSETIINSISKTHRLIVLEDHQKNGGLGEAIASLLLTNNIKCQFIHLAIDNQFGRSAKNYHDLYNLYHIGQKDLIKAINKIL
jgi:transketolase